MMPDGGGGGGGNGCGGEPVRLHKLLAEAGVASRRKCEGLIAAGRVRVDGAVVSQAGTKATRGALIEVDGVPVRASAGRGFVYVLLNKPDNCVSTVSDPQGRRTALDVVLRAPPASGGPLPKGARIYPVGRLDYHTTGLLMLTDDGAFAHYATHPGNGVEKVYEAVTDREPSGGALDALRGGVAIGGGIVSAPARVRACEEGRGGIGGGAGRGGGAGSHIVQIALREGRNRQVRRMLEAVGLGVVRLRRVAIGGLDLRSGPYAGLPAGAWVRVTRAEAMRVAEPAAFAEAPR